MKLFELFFIILYDCVNVVCVIMVFYFVLMYKIFINLVVVFRVIKCKDIEMLK